MSSAIQSVASLSRGRMFWVGWIMSGLAIAFLLLDATLKLLALPFVLEASASLGFPDTPAMARGLGALLLLGTVLHIAPRTTVLGALLVTAFLGGSVAAHLRLGHPLFTHILFGAYAGVLLWGGLWLRDAAIRKLLPFRIDG